MIPNIDYLIIDTISEIQQPIANIAHSETQEDPQFHNFLDFPKVYSTFYDFPDAQVGGSRPLEPLETDPPCTTIPCPRPNFNFGVNIATNQPQLAPDAIVVPGAQHPLPKHPEKLLPNFDPNKDVNQKIILKNLCFI